MANLGNFGTSLVATAPSPATSGTSLIVTAGEGADFITVPFYATAHPATEIPVKTNSEVVLVTARSTDTLTITRAQKGTTAKSIAVGWRLSNAIYAEDIRNGSYINNEVPGGTVNGSNTAFTTASQYLTGYLQVFKNGLLMKGGGNDYTEVSGGFTMTTAPASGTLLLVSYRVGLTSDYSVGTNSTLVDEVPAGLINSSNTTYTLVRAYIANSLKVYVNGVRQQRSVDFTETTPSSGIFTMTAAPLTGDALTVDYDYNLNPSSNADTVDGYHGDDLMPIGALLDYASETLPSANWLLCYGQAISRTTYATLFTRLGTVFGVGDGSTTFNLPDLRGRVIAGQDDMGGSSANRLTAPPTTGSINGDTFGNTGGQETHVQVEAELATHSHNPGNVYNLTSGVAGSYANLLSLSAFMGNQNMALAATGSGTGFNVVQPTIILNKIIKAL